MGDGHPSFPDRREFLRRGFAGGIGLGLSTLGLRLAPAVDEASRIPADILAIPDRSAAAPADPVGIVRCRTYDLEPLAKALGQTLDLVGGIEKLVRGKSVAVKVNLTGTATGKMQMAGLPAARTFHVHPHLVEALCGLLSRAGAKRIVLLESFYANVSAEEMLVGQEWPVERVRGAGDGKVKFADTKARGEFPDYAPVKVAFGGYVFPAYLLNRHYVDTDVFISVAKMKQHGCAGITGAVKNLFGITPTALYGADAPNELTTSNREAVLHSGKRKVPAGVPAEKYGDTPREPFYRVPRVTSDMMGIRPVDLSIIDAVETVVGGEGNWSPKPHRPLQPGLLLAGRNAVTTDSVMCAAMGYDPQAPYGEKPFPGENHLQLLARAGVGANDPGKIEVRGVGLREALCEFDPTWKKGWVRRRLLEG